MTRLLRELSTELVTFSAEGLEVSITLLILDLLWMFWLANKLNLCIQIVINERRNTNKNQFMCLLKYLNFY